MGGRVGARAGTDFTTKPLSHHPHRFLGRQMLAVVAIGGAAAALGDLALKKEKRLRRMRNGMIVSSIGFGGAIGFSVMNIFLKEDFLVMLAGLSIITFFIGLSFVINGLLLSIPKKSLSDKSSDAKSQRELDVAEANTNELLMPETDTVFTSVTEHTTQQKKKKQPLSRS